MYPSCPHCGGVLYRDTDGYAHFFICMWCAREFDFNMRPVIISTDELHSRYGIKLTSGKEYANIR